MKIRNCERCKILMNDQNPQQWGVVWVNPAGGQKRVCAVCFRWLKAKYGSLVELPPMPKAVADWRPAEPKEGDRATAGVKPLPKVVDEKMANDVLLKIARGEGNGERIGDELGIGRWAVSFYLRRWLPSQVGDEVVEVRNNGQKGRGGYFLTPAGQRYLKAQGLI